VVWLLCSKIFDKEVCASKTWYLPTRLHTITSQRMVYSHHCENIKFHNSSCRLWKLFQVHLVVIYEVQLKYKVLVEREFNLPIRLGVLQVSLFNSPFLRPVVLGIEVFRGTRILKFCHCADKIHYTSSFMNTAVTSILIGSATVNVQPFLRKIIFGLKM